jgi:hypothetical protein
MNWFKQSSNKDFVARVKKMLKEHPFTQAIAAYYNIPLSEIDDGLEIEIADLDGKYAEGNGKLIRLNRKVIDENFFRDGFHYVIHEFFHWLKRRSEDKFYFNDPEEIQSFVLQMSWQIVNGKSPEEVKKMMYPIIGSHFENNERKLKFVFKEMLEKAIYLANIYEKEKNFSMI